MDADDPNPSDEKIEYSDSLPVESPHSHPTKSSNWIVLSFAILLAVLGVAMFWAIAIQPLANLAGPVVPPEERYHYIDGILEEIDYKNTGTVLEESYDKFQRSSSPARFEAIIEGSEAFELLSSRLLASESIDCEGNETTVSCVMKRPMVDLVKRGSDTVLLVISDSGRGLD